MTDLFILTLTNKRRKFIIKWNVTYILFPLPRLVVIV